MGPVEEPPSKPPLDMPWPFDSETIVGDIALRFAASLEDDPRIDAALDVDFDRHGVVNAAAVIVQPSWVDKPADPSDPFASMIPQSIEIHIDNVAVPELAPKLKFFEVGLP